MSTRQYDSATDLITFSRASGGTALRKVAYGSELVTNGTFDTDLSGWVDASGGLSPSSVIAQQAHINNSEGDGLAGIAKSFTTVVGKVYALTGDLVSTANGARLGVGAGANDVSLGDTGQITEAQSPELVFVATGTTTYVNVYTFPNAVTTAGQTSVWDNISVKEVLFDQGDLTLFNHPADIPRIEYDSEGNVLGLLVEESRTNLVTYSEDFTANYWGYTGSSVSSNAAIAPDGNETADKLVEDDQSGNHQINWGLSNITLSTDTPLSFSIFAKAGERTKLAFRWGVWVFCTFDLSDGSVTPLVNSTYVVTNADAVDCGNGWYRCQFTITNTGTTALAQASWRILDAGGSQSYLGDGVSGVYIWGAQLE